jgi:hypothetical protein
MTIWVADAHAHVPGLLSVVKMATLLEEYNTEEQTSVRFFFVWVRGPNAKDIH